MGLNISGEIAHLIFLTSVLVRAVVDVLTSWAHKEISPKKPARDREGAIENRESPSVFPKFRESVGCLGGSKGPMRPLLRISTIGTMTALFLTRRQDRNYMASLDTHKRSVHTRSKSVNNCLIASFFFWNKCLSFLLGNWFDVGVAFQSFLVHT